MLVLVAIVLLARLIGPAMAADATPWLDDVPICHAGESAPDQPAQHRHDCLECLACHVAAHAVFIAPAPVMPQCHRAVRAMRYTLPPATAPPARTRLKSSPPIGPPYAAI
jgi:hypothetical protein